MAGVWIFAENREYTLELINAGKSLAEKLGTKLAAFSLADQELAQQYINCGADEILNLPLLAEDQPLESYVPSIAEAARKEDPDILLITATSRGKEIAARIAARLNTGLCSECTSLDFTDNKTLEMKRMLFGGAAIQTVTCSARPVMAAIPPHTFEPAAQLGNRDGVIREISIAEPSAVKIIERKPRDKQAGDINISKRLVCVGRGIEKEEDLQLARDLAGSLDGDMACTRPIAEELHWMPEETYIGLSGQKVKPDLYIGIGISGQIQHTTGIRDARIICAVNKDEDAPIFKISDYGIIGDLYEILPALSQELARIKKK